MSDRFEWVDAHACTPTDYMDDYDPDETEDAPDRGHVAIAIGGVVIEGTQAMMRVLLHKALALVETAKPYDPADYEPGPVCEDCEEEADEAGPLGIRDLLDGRPLLCDTCADERETEEAHG